MYSVIVGNDWLRKVNATIDFNTSTMVIRDGEKAVHIPCTYLRECLEPEPEEPKEPVNEEPENHEETEYLFGEE